MAYCFREHMGFPVDDQERDESEIKSLCALIITEPDPEKLEELIQQLKHPSGTQRNTSGHSPSQRKARLDFCFSG
jgi:hypothetical protein